MPICLNCKNELTHEDLEKGLCPACGKALDAQSQHDAALGVQPPDQAPEERPADDPGQNQTEQLQQQNK